MGGWKWSPTRTPPPNRLGLGLGWSPTWTPPSPLAWPAPRACPRAHAANPQVGLGGGPLMWAAPKIKINILFIYLIYLLIQLINKYINYHPEHFLKSPEHIPMIPKLFRRLPEPFRSLSEPFRYFPNTFGIPPITLSSQFLIYDIHRTLSASPYGSETSQTCPRHLSRQ